MAHGGEGGMERAHDPWVRGRGFGPWRGDEGGGHGLCDQWDEEWRRLGERSGGGTHWGLAMEGRGGE